MTCRPQFTHTHTDAEIRELVRQPSPGVEPYYNLMCGQAGLMYCRLYRAGDLASFVARADMAAPFEAAPLEDIEAVVMGSGLVYTLWLAGRPVALSGIAQDGELWSLIDARVKRRDWVYIRRMVRSVLADQPARELHARLTDPAHGPFLAALGFQPYSDTEMRKAA